MSIVLIGEAVCVNCVDFFHDSIILKFIIGFCRKKNSCRFCASRRFGKSPAAGKVLPEGSESLPPPEKCFPKVRKISRRWKSASRRFGKSPAAGKVLPESSESLPPPEKCFPKIRKVSRRRKSASRKFGKLSATWKILLLAAKYTI